MLEDQDRTNPCASVREKVLQSILDETSQNAAADPCVICLENISEKATAQPCKHNNFDFICLASWIQEKSTCPLCKAVITAIHYGTPGQPKVYKAKSESVASSTDITSSSAWIEQFRGNGRYSSRRPIPRSRKRPRPPSPSNEAILARRKRIYELDLYSLHVGSNRLSGYSDLTPSRFIHDPHLVSRARKWIRRELSLFDSLNASRNNDSGQNSYQKSLPQARHASANAEFLLEYIVAILKTVDIKGSRGQAQEMLSGFLGENSALFLHELNSWLRSPFEELSVWDRNVRYNWPEREDGTFDRRTRNETITRSGEERVSSKRRIYEHWTPD